MSWMSTSIALMQFHRLLFSFSNLSIIDWVVDSFCLNACLDTLGMQTNLCTPQSVEISPKCLFFGPRSVKIGCLLAVCTWNDGCSSLHGLVQRLELQPTLSSLHVLQAQDLERSSRSVYKECSSAKLLKKACRRKHKGNEDNNEAQEGGKMYAVEEIGEQGPNVTICPPCKKAQNVSCLSRVKF